VTNSSGNREQKKLEQLANEYRGEGYDVTTHPARADVPARVRDFGFDLLARRGNEVVVVQVKWSDQSKAGEETKRISELVKNQPNIRFDFVAIGRHEEPDDAASIDVRELCARLREAQDLLSSGLSQAALLVTWSAAEGSLRHLARKKNVNLGKQSPLLITKTLFSEGLLSKVQYTLLERAVRYRNVAVHGFTVDQIDDSVTKRVIKLAQEILECP